MKIAAIFFSLNAPGGSASAFLSLLNALEKRGHKVDVYCYFFDPRKCFPELTRFLKIHYFKLIEEKSSNLDSQRLLNRLNLAADYYLRAKSLYQLMKNKKYDLVFTAEACAYIPALIYKKFYHTPVFWSVFDPLSLVDRERPGLLLNRYRWFEYLLRIHNVFDARNIRKIDKVIVPTTRMKRRLDAFYQIDTKVLPTGGVRKSDYQKDLSLLIARRLKKKFGFEKRGELILLSLGHFLPHRRYEDVLEALNLLLKEGFSNFKYIISGSSRFAPAYFRQIKNLVGKYGLDSFVLLDDSLKTNQEVVGFYQFCDVFLFVSVEQTWGLAPLEALMAGKPIIISQGVGCVEALSSGENAIVVGEKSPREIAASIKLLQNSKLRHLLAKKGKLFVEENLTYEKIAANLEGYFGQFV